MAASEKKQCTPARDETGATQNLSREKTTENFDEA
jgi:hypothetical protein